MRFSALFLLPAILSSAAAYARVPACSPVADHGLYISNDACIRAHVFDVVTVPGGTRFLDLCSPDTSDEACRVSVVSYPSDGKYVGNLELVRGKDILIRGAMQNYNGRYLLILNDERQLRGGPARFTPDPRLLRSTSAEDAAGSNQMELRVNFHHRGKKLEKQ